MGGDGFAFISANEVSALDTEQYGTNFTTEAFVREQLAEWVGADANDAIRLPRGLCFQQDLWVVTRGPRNPEPLIYETGPEGGVEWFVTTDGHDFYVSGWAGDTGYAALGASSHPIARVEVSFSDGTTVDADLGLPRPEIADYLGHPGDPVLSASGWVMRGRTRRRLRLTDVLTVTAVCQHGARFVLDSTRVNDMLNRTGGQMPPPPLQRRLKTAKVVYHHRGPGGLVELAPTFVRNEWGRLKKSIGETIERRTSRA